MLSYVFHAYFTAGFKGDDGICFMPFQLMILFMLIKAHLDRAQNKLFAYIRWVKLTKKIIFNDYWLDMFSMQFVDKGLVQCNR